MKTIALQLLNFSNSAASALIKTAGIMGEMANGNEITTVKTHSWLLLAATVTNMFTIK